jgi:hypothetical protein
MLSSHSKIQKLFIKHLMWNRIKKAEKLLTAYPDCCMPWQKAFEESAKNNSFEVCIWIMNQRLIYNFEINIHYNNDELIQIFTTKEYGGKYYNQYRDRIIKLAIMN